MEINRVATFVRGGDEGPGQKPYAKACTDLPKFIVLKFW